jgi:phenylalanyl-tRNA synthetase beta chain
LKNLSVIDIYKGEKIEEGYKSITFSMFFVSEDYTLTDNEVDDIIKNILLNLSEIGVYLRQK